MIIVGICGASGSGKSTLAKRIQDSLACSCTIIGQDCYYRNFPDLPFSERIKLNYDEPEIFDFDELLRDIEQLESGQPITTKGYDYVNYLRADTPDVLIPPPEVLVLEGIHMFTTSASASAWRSRCIACGRGRVPASAHQADIKARGRSIDNIAERTWRRSSRCMKNTSQTTSRRGFCGHARRQEQDGRSTPSPPI
jgi:uridine kinase